MFGQLIPRRRSHRPSLTHTHTRHLPNSKGEKKQHFFFLPRPVAHFYGLLPAFNIKLIDCAIPLYTGIFRSTFKSIAHYCKRDTIPLHLWDRFQQLWETNAIRIFSRPSDHPTSPPPPEPIILPTHGQTDNARIIYWKGFERKWSNNKYNRERKEKKRLGSSFFPDGWKRIGIVFHQYHHHVSSAERQQCQPFPTIIFHNFFFFFASCAKVKKWVWVEGKKEQRIFNRPLALLDQKASNFI